MTLVSKSLQDVPAHLTFLVLNPTDGGRRNKSRCIFSHHLEKKNYLCKCSYNGHYGHLCGCVGQCDNYIERKR